MASSVKSKAPVKPVKRLRTPSSLLNEIRTLRLNRTYDDVLESHRKKKIQVDTFLKCKAVTALMVMEEKKQPIPTFRGTDAPSALSHGHPSYIFTDTKESIILRVNIISLGYQQHLTCPRQVLVL